MTPLAELAAACGLKCPNKPHKLAAPLTEHLSGGDLRVHISNPTFTSIDVIVHVRGRWGMSAWGVAPTLKNIQAVVDEARQHIDRIEALIAEGDTQLQEAA